MIATDESLRIAEDLRIVGELRAGTRGSMRRFAERMQCVPRILAALNARMGRPLDAHELEDLAQETILVILRKIDDYEGRSPIEGWAYRICYFELANWTRRKLREPRERKQPEELDEAPAVAAPDPWRYEDLHRALARLPADERVIVRLRHFRDLTFEAIATEVDVKLSTVKARYYRGLDTLRQVATLKL